MLLALVVLSLVCWSRSKVKVMLAMALACVRPSSVGPDVGGLVGVSLRVGLLPFLAPQH